MSSRTVLLVVVGVLLVVLFVTRSRPTPIPATVEEPPVATGKKAKPRRPTAAPGLVKPKPKPCVAPPEIEGEADVAASAGLAYDEARAALNTFAPELVSCLGPDESPTGTLLLRITVACTGLVQSAAINDFGDWPPAAAACVTGRLAYAEFPAHGLPDGDVVDWPLRYTPP